MPMYEEKDLYREKVLEQYELCRNVLQENKHYDSS